MCGRISCHLCRPDYRKAASYYDESQRQFVQPDWVDAPNAGLSYCPSTNMAPTEVLPVLISKNHVKASTEELTDRVIKPMMWGMIPPWHKGEYKSHRLSTNNCRIETIQQSRLYGNALRNGKRCVIGCQGFYEWQTTDKRQPKQPYFIKASQESDVGPVEESSSWENGTWDESQGWTGPQLLMMAGLFDVWTSSKGEEMFSFSIITMESNNHFGWLHHRMPAVLDSNELINSWLDYNKVPGAAAVNLLQPVISLTWHSVSIAVNNSRNKDKSCNKPINPTKCEAEI